MRKLKLSRLLIIPCLLVLLFPALSFCQDVKDTMFKEASQNINEARKAQADLLAPKNYSIALKSYKEAESDFDKGRNLDAIRQKLRTAITYLKKASEAAKLANVTFVQSIKARKDAQSAEAQNYAGEQWKQAEIRFLEAAARLEDGNVNDAKKRSSEAEALYRQAELAAIKANYLNETWELLKQATEKDVEKYAPQTLADSRELVSKAENELNTNRYDTDVARDLARQAKYQAQHAIYLAKVVKYLRENKDNIENYLQDTELPLTKIAAAMDFVATFDEGFDKTTSQIIDGIKVLQDSLARLNEELQAGNDQIALLKARIDDMTKKLGGVEQEKSALSKRMEAQAKIREQFAAVEKMFTRDEAQVFRTGNDIIIRMVGLNFSVGKSTIEPQYFNMLTKVQNAIKVFPECTVIVEGHTDSFGSDELNYGLSQQRSDAVKQYIIANMGIEEPKISSIGYGENRPIANNETTQGRAKNRRIDIVIHPELPGDM
jgi:OOP family OmpA-OmpF porin